MRECETQPGPNTPHSGSSQAAPLRMRPQCQSQEAAATQAALWQSSPTPACLPVPILDWFTFTGIMRHENCAGQDLKAALISKESRSGSLLSKHGRASHPCSIHPTHNTSHCPALLCAFQKAIHTSKPFCKGNWSKTWFVSFPLSILRKYIPRGTSVCVVKDKLCNHCTRTKHGIVYKPDSDSF